MLKSRNFFRLVVPCLALVGIVLALASTRWPSPVRAGQNPAQQRRQTSLPPQPTISMPSSPDAPAATITVNSVADGAPANNGQCTLREALLNANANNQSGSTDCTAGSGADIINFSLPGGAQTINLTGVLPAISESLTINGTGANLLTVRRDTGGNYNIFVINGGITVGISGLTITNGNTTGDGGGIATFGNLTITDCAITANQARIGGGILSLGGTTNIIRTTISGNTASDGGGLFIQSTNTVTMTNSTVSGNTGTTFTGGITVLGEGGAPVTLTMTNCTVTGNTGVTEGGIATVDNTNTSPATTNLMNNIVANNSLPNITKINTMAMVISQGNNLANDNGSGLLTGPGDLINTNPQLSALGNNGGPTKTHVLLATSPAINAGNNTGAPSYDQRGVGRPQAGTVDIGAVEAGLQFYPLASPVRLLDTRNGTSPNACSQPNAAITGGSTRTQSARNFCGIPSNAVAITGNVTTPLPTGSGFLTFFPSDAMQPTVANTNFTLNSVINNVYTVGLGSSDGAFNIFAATTTNVVVDVTGYYAPPSANGLYFHTLPTPVRLLDTRSGATVGCFRPGMPIAASGTLLQLGANTCGIPSTAKALVGNATSVLPPGPGFLTLYPNGAMQPFVATSNYRGSDVINGPFTVALGTGNQFNIFSSNTADVVMDILGYFSLDATDTNGAGLLLSQIAHPVRLLDTRPIPFTACITPRTRLQSQAFVYDLVATDVCEATGFSAARAIVGNATVVAPDNNGFMTLFPKGQPLPFTAASNFRTGVANNRHFFVGLNATTGEFSIFFNMGGTQFFTDLVIDVSGYFTP